MQDFLTLNYKDFECSYLITLSALKGRRECMGSESQFFRGRQNTNRSYHLELCLLCAFAGNKIWSIILTEALSLYLKKTKQNPECSYCESTQAGYTLKIQKPDLWIPGSKSYVPVQFTFNTLCNVFCSWLIEDQISQPQLLKRDYRLWDIF